MNPNLTGTKYIQLVTLITISILVSCRTETNKPQSPNIIYILADDLGYGDISTYNANGKINTPHIDRMALDGMKFTDAHTSSSVCTPTRYGILTGRYNWRSPLKNGVLTGNSKALIPTSRTTVASLLKDQGYETAFIGKWHLGWNWGMKDSSIPHGEGWTDTDFENIDFTKPITNNPNGLGFDYAYGHAGSLDMAPYVYVENGIATDIPDTTSVNTGKYSWWRKGPTSKDFIHGDVTPNFFRRAIVYIKLKAKEKKPFFLYLALPSPHTPILPTPEWVNKSKLNPYADFVMMVDNYVGQVLETIESAGIENNTLIVFTSDNGCSPAAGIDDLINKGHYPSHLYRGHKADIYEGGHRVPFIVKWPDKIEKGQISEEIICSTDLLATCADIVDYKLADNEGEDSYSMVPLFDNPELESPLRAATIHHSINGSFAIRKDEWKLIMCPGSGGWSYPRPDNKVVIDTLPRIQLFNLNNDPGETNNLQDVHIEKVQSLKALLTKHILQGRSTLG